MRRLPVFFTALFAALAVAAIGPAKAQNASPQQIQGLIASGQEQTALSQLHGIVQANPDSGVAWYLTAEAQDASGNEGAARTSLAKAEQLSPGLPFAQPNQVAALQSHLNGAGMQTRHHSGISGVLVGIIGLVVLFLVLRMLFRPRRQMGRPGYPDGHNPGFNQPPGPYPYGPAPGGMGGGLGSSLLGGLAAGAGFAAGERVIDDVFGRNNNQQGPFQQDQNFGNGGIDGRDDGLTGNPGWDDGSNNQDDNFDPGNNW